jgi:hypothetical protein
MKNLLLERPEKTIITRNFIMLKPVDSNTSTDYFSITPGLFEDRPYSTQTQTQTNYSLIGN